MTNGSVSNASLCQRDISTYLCPSNPYLDAKDPAGFGNLDYFATVYTDISDGTKGGAAAGNRDSVNYRAEGALSVSGGSTNAADSAYKTTPSDFVIGTQITSVPVSAISDGTSNTLAVIEDAGRICPNGATPYYGGTYGSYAETGDTTTMATVDLNATKNAGVVMRGVWRWADPDAGGSGISGPTSNGTSATTQYTGRVVNQNNYPVGGPTGHSWTVITKA